MVTAAPTKKSGKTLVYELLDSNPEATLAEVKVAGIKISGASFAEYKKQYRRDRQAEAKAARAPATPGAGLPTSVNLGVSARTLAAYDVAAKGGFTGTLGEFIEDALELVGQNDEETDEEEETEEEGPQPRMRSGEAPKGGKTADVAGQLSQAGITYVNVGFRQAVLTAYELFVQEGYPDSFEAWVGQAIGEYLRLTHKRIGLIKGVPDDPVNGDWSKVKVVLAEITGKERYGYSQPSPAA